MGGEKGLVLQTEMAGMHLTQAATISCGQESRDCLFADPLHRASNKHLRVLFTRLPSHDRLVGCRLDGRLLDLLVEEACLGCENSDG